MDIVKYLLLLAAGFVLGSIPFGIMIAKAKGVDLKKVGSGNIGATNVLRSLGTAPAILTLLGDILKGTMAVALGMYFGLGPLFTGLVGISAILGHTFSLFLGFRGGKGVATSIGVIGLFTPLAALITVSVWLASVIVFRYSSLGALMSFSVFPFAVALFDNREKLPIALFITVLIFFRHRDNIKRLLSGNERRIGQRE